MARVLDQSPPPAPPAPREAKAGTEGGYSLAGRLVIGIASSALFDLSEPDQVFAEQGLAAYRRFQDEHIGVPLAPGAAFPFIRRLLSLNDLSSSPEDPLVEVIIMSRNDADTGLRVMRSVAHYELPIVRAIFTQGSSPWAYMDALNMSLFLSADPESVLEAVHQGLPAGTVLNTSATDDPSDAGLRIAFDFDGVIVDDASERIFKDNALNAFLQHETENVALPHNPGPLKRFLTEICRIQQFEETTRATDPDYQPRLRTAIITARSAPSHERAIMTLKSWGLRVNDAFFLGGIDKGAITSVLRPHIFFDDQARHVQSTMFTAPSVHIPFGVRNLPDD